MCACVCVCVCVLYIYIHTNIHIYIHVHIYIRDDGASALAEAISICSVTDMYPPPHIRDEGASALASATKEAVAHSDVQDSGHMNSIVVDRYESGGGSEAVVVNSSEGVVISLMLQAIKVLI